ncbi:MAG: hypothetical protein ACR2LF_09840 [Jatrophihabitantaceae bacterium]
MNRRVNVTRYCIPSSPVAQLAGQPPAAVEPVDSPELDTPLEPPLLPDALDAVTSEVMTELVGLA